MEKRTHENPGNPERFNFLKWGWAELQGHVRVSIPAPTTPSTTEVLKVRQCHRMAP